MNRTASTLLTTLALTTALAGPAAAAPGDGPGATPPPHGHRTSVTAPLCVTTTWRAAHTGRPKTRIGQVCRATPGMWVSRHWAVVAVEGRDRIVRRTV